MISPFIKISNSRSSDFGCHDLFFFWISNIWIHYMSLPIIPLCLDWHRSFVRTGKYNLLFGKHKFVQKCFPTSKLIFPEGTFGEFVKNTVILSKRSVLIGLSGSWTDFVDFLALLQVNYVLLVLFSEAHEQFVFEILFRPHHEVGSFVHNNNYRWGTNGWKIK